MKSKKTPRYQGVGDSLLCSMLLAHAVDHSIGPDEELLAGNGNTGAGLVISSLTHLGAV